MFNLFLYILEKRAAFVYLLMVFDLLSYLCTLTLYLAGKVSFQNELRLQNRTFL